MPLSTRSDAHPAVTQPAATLVELAQQLAAGELTARRLVAHYRARIAVLDPLLRSVVELNPDADALAAALDAERAAGHVRGPLHGIPILLKDNIDTGDRMQTTAGSLALVGPPAPADAFLVARLRAAGALILGKTNLSEWANFRSTRSTSGWSARGGLTRNPHALDRSAYGSSTGAAVAVAAGFAPAAIGTETDGSVVAPASACSVVGLKPTVGLVSRSGVIPISASQDTAGVLARSVADAAVVLGALAGADPADPASAPAAAWQQHDYTRYLDRAGLQGARIGVVRGLVDDPRLLALFERALTALREAGVTLIDPVPMPDRSRYREAERTIMLCEFKDGLNRYLATRRDLPVQTLADLMVYNVRWRAREMPYFNQELLEQAQATGGTADPAYRAALATVQQIVRAEGNDHALAAHRLDALLAPTAGVPWTLDLTLGDRGGGGSSSLAAVAGYPGISVPLGFVNGLPVGVSFWTAAWGEPMLLRLAYAFEQQWPARRDPQFGPTARAEET